MSDVKALMQQESSFKLSGARLNYDASSLLNFAGILNLNLFVEPVTMVLLGKSDFAHKT